LLSQSALPFRSSSGVAAKNAGELKNLLSGLLEESDGKRAVRALQLYSPAGARGALGQLPPGFEEGGQALFALRSVGGYVRACADQRETCAPVGLVRR
jgi:hypothetical protein